MTGLMMKISYQKKMDKTEKDTVTLEVPKNIFADPGVSAMLDQTKGSNRVATGVVASILKASGADLNSFNISNSTLLRQRNKAREVISVQVKSEFDSKKPDFACCIGTGN